jgi:hypothetical protein
MKNTCCKIILNIFICKYYYFYFSTEKNGKKWVPAQKNPFYYLKGFFYKYVVETDFLLVISSQWPLVPVVLLPYISKPVNQFSSEFSIQPKKIICPAAPEDF